MAGLRRRRPVQEHDHRVQHQSDQAADQGAVEADVLQVAADAQFQLLDQVAFVPGLDRLRDVVGHQRRRADRDVDGDAAGAEQRFVGDQFARADAGYSRGRLEQRQGDLTGDGRVLLNDFALWRNNAEPGALAALGIPEPGSLALIAAAGLTGCFRRGRRDGSSAS